MRTKLGAAWTALVLAKPTVARAAQEQPPAIGDEERDAFAKILEFFNTIADWLGQLLMELIHFIVPSVSLPGSIVDTMGILALLTVVLVLVDLARRLVWIVVGVGWLLIAIRIVTIVTQSSGAGS